MASGPYQSKLLNFLNRKNLQVQTVLGQRWRELQVVVTWGVQIVLYPIYAAFQAGQFARQQLGGDRWGFGGGTIAAGSDPEPSQDLEATEPIAVEADGLGDPEIQVTESALAFAQQLTLQRQAHQTSELIIMAVPQPQDTAAIAPSAPRDLAIADPWTTASVPVGPQPTSIQGIACTISDRTLTLVGPQNQLIPLHPDEQQRLQTQLNQLIAEYLHWHQNHQPQNHNPPQPQFPHPTPSKTAKTIAPQSPHPLRWFRRFVNWMARSPVAIAADLFQESQLQESQLQESQRFSALPPGPEVPWLELPAAQFANPSFSLEKLWGWLWGRPVPSPTPSPVPSTSSASAGARVEPRSPSPDPPATASPGQPARSSLPPSPRPYPLALRKVAPGQLPLPQGTSASLAIASPDPGPGSQAKPTKAASNWRSQLPQPSPRQHPAPPAAPPSASPAAPRGRLTKAQVALPQTPASAPSSRPGRSTALPVQPPTSLLPSETLDGLVPNPSAEEQAPTYAPTWIETKAVPTGYVRHPLEILLAWLDWIFVWLERQSLRLWRWLTQ